MHERNIAFVLDFAAVHWYIASMYQWMSTVFLAFIQSTVHSLHPNTWTLESWIDWMPFNRILVFHSTRAWMSWNEWIDGSIFFAYINMKNSITLWTNEKKQIVYGAWCLVSDACWILNMFKAQFGVGGIIRRIFFFFL